MATNMIPAAFLRDCLDALKAATAPLDGAVVKLFENNITPDQTTVLGDFTEATFTGYAPSAAITWGDAYTDILGQSHLVGDLKVFTQTAITATCTVYGYYLVDGTTLVAAQRFDTPIPMVAVGSAVLVVPTFEVMEAPEAPLP